LRLVAAVVAEAERRDSRPRRYWLDKVSREAGISPNVELLRRAVEAYNTRDIDALIAIADPSIVEPIEP
jgi:hypothetical protein